MKVTSVTSKISASVTGCLLLVVVLALPIWFVHSYLLDAIPLVFPISLNLTLPLNFYCFLKTLA